MDGLVTLASAFGAKETTDRLLAAIGAKGLTVFARIDHAQGATGVGLELLPTEVLIFGNARAGTPLMQNDQRIGLDLPLKVLVWQDAVGKVWLAYNDPTWLAARYALGEPVQPVVRAMAAALAGLARAATEP